MRSRIIGGIAFVLGLVFTSLMLFGKDPIQFRPLLGGLAFIGLGGYYLLTGKRAATRKEFIMEGKLAHDDPPAEKNPGLP